MLFYIRRDTEIYWREIKKEIKDKKRKGKERVVRSIALSVSMEASTLGRLGHGGLVKEEKIADNSKATDHEEGCKEDDFALKVCLAFLSFFL